LFNRISWKWGSKHFVYAGLFAIAAGLICGLSMSDSMEALGSFELPDGRLNSIYIRPGLRVIDDSYNASPDAMLSALETLRASSEKVKIAVLGEMRELGSFTESCHEAIGKAVALAASHLIAVGPAGGHVCRAAIQERFDSEHIWSVASPLEAYRIMQSVIDSSAEDCVVLLKGARFAHMERIRLGLAGVTVTCDLPICSLYINCSTCPKLGHYERS
jgi:UDP-N-acetylmuramoyl-tripeptide--D-alanyl-D-alanine ligase